MYLFSFKYGNGFGKYYRVFKTEKILGNPGDLVQVQDDCVLLLGDEISFPEKYEHQYPVLNFSKREIERKEKNGFFDNEQERNKETLLKREKISPKILFPQLFDERTLQFLHWMVLEWFSDYKSVIRYFIPLDIDELWKRFPSEGKRKQNEQNLYVFPDNRTRLNFLAQYYKNDKTHLQLYSTDTDKKKNEHRRMIKQGIAKHIFVTQSEIFQPYQNLKKIYLIDSYKRYYHNQQDPRYSIKTVVEKIKELYQAELKVLDFQNHF